MDNFTIYNKSFRNNCLDNFIRVHSAQAELVLFYPTMLQRRICAEINKRAKSCTDVLINKLGILDVLADVVYKYLHDIELVDKFINWFPSDHIFPECSFDFSCQEEYSNQCVEYTNWLPFLDDVDPNNSVLAVNFNVEDPDYGKIGIYNDLEEDSSTTIENFTIDNIMSAKCLENETKIS